MFWRSGTVIVLVLSAVGAATKESRQHMKAYRQIFGDKFYRDHGFFPTCRIAFFREPKTLGEARNTCKEMRFGDSNLKLASLDDDDAFQELQIAQEIALPKAKIKGKNNNMQWVWLDVKKQGKIYVGPNNKDLGKNLHAHDQPICPQGGHTCPRENIVLDHKGKFGQVNAMRKFPFACAVIRPSYIISSNQVTWAKAKFLCESAGFRLAIVRPEDLGRFKVAMNFFLGKKDDSLEPFDSRNWVWVGGTDREEEGEWEWAYKNSGFPIDNWTAYPWREVNRPKITGKETQPDDAMRIGSTGQDAMAINRDGQYDDSYINVRRKRAFACSCNAPKFG